MTDCNVNINSVILADGTLDVVSKLRTLTDEALGTNSVYMRAKDTFKELFDGKKISEAEYAQLASGFVSQLAVSTTQGVMQGALEWAKQEKEMAYSLAAMKAQADLTIATIERTKHEICKIDKEIDLQCANTTAVLSASIRENGRVATRDASNPCIPLTLENEGVKYDQKEVYQAQTYTALADAYRKSGKVYIAPDADGVRKGLSGDDAGYTDAQEEFARRQVLSFEDSKRNHAANAMSQMIGQMLSAEVAPKAEDVSRWRTAIDYLNSNTASTMADSYFTATSKQALFTSILSTVGSTVKDTTAEIVQLSSIANRIVDTANGSVVVYPALTAAEFALITITGVTTGNLNTVLSAIGATDNSGLEVDTVAKIQAIVDVAL